MTAKIILWAITTAIASSRRRETHSNDDDLHSTLAEVIRDLFPLEFEEEDNNDDDYSDFSEQYKLNSSHEK